MENKDKETEIVISTGNDGELYVYLKDYLVLKMELDIMKRLLQECEIEKKN